MKIEINITIELKRPVIEVEEIQPPSEERVQTTLEAFKQSPTGTSRVGVCKYGEGRKVHRCSNCNAPNRRIGDSGYCRDAMCILANQKVGAGVGE